MKYAYYPGCSLHSSAHEYDQSMRAVFSQLGMELEEIEDWVCCGSTPAHMANELLSVALPLMNLLPARRQGLDVVVPCAACFSAFKVAIARAESDDHVRGQLASVLDEEYEGVRVLHALEAITDGPGLERISEQSLHSLRGLRVACYYGCLLTRPPKVKKFDDAENPQSMDRLVSALGGEPVEWSHKGVCCGASFSLTVLDVVHSLTGDILEQAKKAGADCILVACPLCHSNLDLRQGDIERERDIKIGLPILYFTQLLGLALGCEPESLGLDKNFVSPGWIIDRITANDIELDSAAGNEAEAAALRGGQSDNG